MNWRDFKLPTPIDKIDKIDKTPQKIGFVDIVDIVDRVQPTKKASEVHLKPSMEKPIWKNPYPMGSPEARRATLQVVMGEMALEACNKIIEEYRKRGIPLYKATPETLWAENENTRIHDAVLNGTANIEDYKKTCDNWVHSSCKSISKSTGGEK